jgi:hypothetical protein
MNHAMNEDNVRVFRAFATTLDRLQSMHAAVMLRPKDVCPDTAFHSDYDLLFDPARFAEILAVAVSQCRHYSVSMIVDQRKSYLRRIFFVSDNNAEERITLELWPHAELTLPGRFLAATGTVEWQSARRFFTTDRTYLAIQPAVSAAIYLTHLYHKQKALDSPEVRRRLALYRDTLSKSTDHVHADLCRIIDALGGSDADLGKANMQAYAILLQMGVGVRIRRTLPALQRMRRRLARLIGGNGFGPVPVLGPDGSGKTAIISALGNQEGLPTFKFKKIFRFSLPYRCYHFVQRQFGSPPYARNMVDEGIVHLILLTSIVRWWPFAMARAVRSYWRRGAARTIVVDRYFWDYLLTLRDAEVLPARISGYRMLSKLVPTPERAVVLCCSSETIHSRKTELTSAAIDCLYELYWDQIARRRVPSVLMLSTDGPFERSYSQAARFLLPRRTAGSSESATRRRAWGSSARAGLGGAEARSAAQRPSGTAL